MRKIILDCDPGMDDSAAIVLAVKSQKLDIQAVTTVNGNYPVDVTFKNARKVLNLLGRMDIPVYKGCDKPLVRPVPRDPFTHGDDGQAGAHLSEPTQAPLDTHAVSAIISIVKKYPGEVTILSTAPMTNIAAAMRLSPEIIPMIPRIIAISGAFGLNEASFLNATGDTPQSEWNVYVDPEAAKIVYDSGVPLTAIGLDVATYFSVDFTASDLLRLKDSERPEAQFLHNAVEFVHGRGFQAYCAVIDCMAVACAEDESLVKTQRGRVGVETKDGLTLGMTVMDRRHHHVWTNLPEIDVAVSADYSRFLHELIETFIR